MDPAQIDRAAQRIAGRSRAHRTGSLARLCLCALAVACAHGRPPGRDLVERLTGPRVGAHRGGFRYVDSNTLARFESARLAGVDAIETDLRLSKDGVVFLFHDADLAPATVCSGPLAERTAAELAACTLRGLDHGPDTFEAMLSWDAGRVVIDADLKAREVIGPALELVRRFDAYEWIFLEAGDGLPLYREIRALDERVALEVGPAAGSGEAGLRELLALRDPRLLVVGLRPETLTDGNVGLVHASGRVVAVNAWTLADEPAEPLPGRRRIASCALAFARGVDVAVSNVPEDCVRQRDASAR